MTQQNNWQAEAQFWQKKYLEEKMHNAQVLAAMSRSLLIAQRSNESEPEGQPEGSNSGLNGVAASGSKQS
jgi:hypothetical protein